jgi:hypothetical protein
MNTNQTKPHYRKENILFYLDKSISKLKLLQLDNIRNKEIYLVSDSAISDISITKKLIETSNLQLPIEIATKVNELYSCDPCISDVLIHFINIKRTPHQVPAYLKLKV